MVIKRLDELKEHPRNVGIYGTVDDPVMTASVKQHGVLTPLLISYDDRIIGGHRRWTAARSAGLEEVSAVVFPSRDEVDILEAVIENNRQRMKTGEMIAREAEALAEIESERAKRRQLSGLKQNGSVGIPVYQRRTRDVVGERLGISSTKASQAVAIGRRLTELENSESRDDKAKAEQLKKVLNERGIKPATALLPKAPPKSLPMAPSPKPRVTLNRTNDNVDWAWWTWNPVTGCLHDCAYCYARDIANRFYPQGFKPTFLPERLPAPRNTPVPRSDEAMANPQSGRIFVCSMADLFGKWVPQEWIDAVFAEVRDNPQWEFLFLTKFPQRLAEIEWPENAWVGTTVDRQYRVDIAEKAFRGVKAGVKWLSCEPLLEPVKFNSLDMFDLVVIGGASKSSQTPEFWPPLDWIIDLIKQARDAGCHVYLKENAISRETPRPKELPRER